MRGRNQQRHVRIVPWRLINRRMPLLLPDIGAGRSLTSQGAFVHAFIPPSTVRFAPVM